MHSKIHTSTAIYETAHISVAVTGTIPQLVFIHESSGRAFVLDIADLVRSTVSMPIAFQAVKQLSNGKGENIESHTRKLAGRTFQKENIIPTMIEQVKTHIKTDNNRDHLKVDQQ